MKCECEIMLTFISKIYFLKPCNSVCVKLCCLLSSKYLIHHRKHKYYMVVSCEIHGNHYPTMGLHQTERGLKVV